MAKGWPCWSREKSAIPNHFAFQMAPRSVQVRSCRKQTCSLAVGSPLCIDSSNACERPLYMKARANDIGSARCRVYSYDPAVLLPIDWRFESK